MKGIRMQQYFEDFKGKVVLITGGGSGIGEAAVRLFATNGAHVVIADYKTAEGTALAETIKASGNSAIFLQTDVRQATQVRSMVEKTIEHFGRIDIAFNNAEVIGVPIVRLADESDDVFNAVIDTGIKGIRLCMKHEINVMCRQGGGIIINNSSIAGLSPIPYGSSYCAAKHGIIGMTNTAMLEYATDNIRFVSICQGWVDTPLIGQLTSHPDTNRMLIEAIPAKRLGTPAEVAELVVWLASSAAAYINGTTFPICGAFNL